MGIYKEYTPAIAGKALRFSLWWENAYHNTDDSRYMQQVPEWYDLNGTVRNHMMSYVVYWNTGTYGACSAPFVQGFINNIGGLTDYRGMNDGDNVIPYATEDILDDFDIYDHEINSIGTTTRSYSVTSSQRSKEWAYIIRIVNDVAAHYEQNVDVIWHDNVEYYIEDQENPGQYIDVTADLLADHSDFTEHYDEYYIFVDIGPITVKCIKFKKKMFYWGGDGDRNCKAVYTLHSAYFLDESEWITIPYGESRNLVIDFSAVTA